jgi:hypothetical protein
MTRVATLFLCLLSPRFLHSQAVTPDSDGRRPPTAEECSVAEPLKPNLVLRSDSDIHGTVVDATKAPFSNSPIQLRKYISETEQLPVKRVRTDSQGNFDLGVVKAGRYRLLLSPNRGFAQPQKLECSAAECKLDVTLTANGTDLVTAIPPYLVIANCPVR